VFPSCHQLLGQQIPMAVGGLDRPPPDGEPLRPCRQLSGQAPAGAHVELRDRYLATINRRRRMGPLVGVDTNRHRHRTPPRIGPVDLTVVTPDMDLRATPVSSHTASRNPGEYGCSFESPPKWVAGTSRARPTGTPQRYGTEPRSTPSDLSGAGLWLSRHKPAASAYVKRPS
jgi:hypothetical protein